MRIIVWLLILCAVALIAVVACLIYQMGRENSRLWDALNAMVDQIPKLRDSIRFHITGKWPPKDDGGEG